MALPISFFHHDGKEVEEASENSRRRSGEHGSTQYRLPVLPVTVNHIPDEPARNGPSVKATPTHHGKRLLAIFNPHKSLGASSSSAFFGNFKENISSRLPSDPKKGRRAIILIIVSMFAILGLILGLAIGLTHKAS
jgi:hypothetical protein